MLICFLTILTANNLLGQSGLQVYAGFSNAKNNNTTITPAKTTHPGYLLGADARLNSDDMYFVLGGQIHFIEFLADNEKSHFTVTNKMRWFKLRFGLGYNLFKLNKKVIIRAKSLGSINVISSIPDIAAPFNNYNNGTAGVNLGLGIDFYNLTFDLEYEKGFFNAVNMVKGTEFNFFTTTLGFFF